MLQAFVNVARMALHKQGIPEFEHSASKFSDTEPHHKVEEKKKSNSAKGNPGSKALTY